MADSTAAAGNVDLMSGGVVLIIVVCVIEEQQATNFLDLSKNRQLLVSRYVTRGRWQKRQLKGRIVWCNRKPPDQKQSDPMLLGFKAAERTI